MPVDESNDRIISIPGGQLVSGSVVTNPNGKLFLFFFFFFIILFFIFYFATI